jgi:hypothetical protein
LFALSVNDPPPRPRASSASIEIDLI